MNTKIKALLLVTMSTAMLMGFMKAIPEARSGWNFERLHVFLFNLCAGGSALLYCAEAKGRVTTASALFFAGSLAYAFCAFYERYVAAIILALALAAVVEYVRARRFPFFPREFFSLRTPAAQKFEHAALLCLSLALIASAFVIFNGEFVRLIEYPKLKLDVFFLGFSFPVSLITMSVMFSLIREDPGARVRVWAQIIFWAVNAGVIVFFALILTEAKYAQLAVSVLLFISVVAMLFLFLKEARDGQRRTLLTSGMGFIVLTGVTGVAYVVLGICRYDPASWQGAYILSLHSFIALYGWNLSGLLVILRGREFPLRANLNVLIAAHWVIVLVLAPLGRFNPVCAFAAAAGFALLLYRYLLSPGARGADTQSN